MPQLHQTTASLRIFGDDLEPDEVTALLGTPPTHAVRRGELRSSRPEASPARTGSWRLQSGYAKPGDLDVQIRDLLALVTDDPAVWRTIHERYKVDLFCGLFMQTTNDGLSLKSDTLAAIAARGLELQLDIYDPAADEG